MDEFVRREGFEFDLALGFDADAGLAKGRPHVERAVQELGIEPDSILLVGDSLKDSDLAAEASVRFVGRVGTFRAAAFAQHRPGTHTINTIEELVALLTTLPAAARTL